MTQIIAGISKHLKRETGQALVVVLVLLMFGSLVMPPVLSYIGTVLKTGIGYQNKTDELYAADSGIEDAIWQIKYDRLEVLFDEPVYDIYNFDDTWEYDLEEPINGITPAITIQNVWIPKDVPHLSSTEARDIIDSNKLMVAGTTSGESSYKIKLDFTPGDGEEDSLIVEEIGVWLPLGFTYVPHSSNLEDDQYADYYAVPAIADYAGGQAVVWSFDSVPYSAFPGVDIYSNPIATEVTLDYVASQSGTSPVAIAWIVTSGVPDVPLAWDIDTRIYKITSVAGDTEIEAYSSKCELRKMGAAIAGDYRALGNSLMVDDHWDYYGIRDTLLAESSAEVTDIPSSADVVAAYLYWSGWFAEGSPEAFFADDCANFGNWLSGSCWNISYSHFQSHYSSGIESTRYNTLKNSVDLSSFDIGNVQVSWDQWEEGSLESSDALRFEFSGDGGTSWSSLITAFSNDIGSTPQGFTYTIPSQYLTDDFKFRFYLQDFAGSDEYCHVDNFAISQLVSVADTSVIFKINDNQVYLDEDNNPQIGSGEISADEAEVLESGDPGQYSYACHSNVTKLIKAYSELGDGENHTGNADYTMGSADADTGYQLSYAGWSLIIIYSSPETAGHQLYLYDTFAYAYDYEYLDFDFDGEPGGQITGFIVPEQIAGEDNAARLTCFVGEGDDFISGDYLEFNGTQLSDGSGSMTNVWDSQSVGMSEDGVDIDTFYVTWASNLLEPGDTTATVGMYTSQDNWNLIYIILSLRSETVTGGTVHYLIHDTS
jgi:hypothetical protein